MPIYYRHLEIGIQWQAVQEHSLHQSSSSLPWQFSSHFLWWSLALPSTPTSTGMTTSSATSKRLILRFVQRSSRERWGSIYWRESTNTPKLRPSLSPIIQMSTLLSISPEDSNYRVLWWDLQKQPYCHDRSECLKRDWQSLNLNKSRFDEGGCLSRRRAGWQSVHTLWAWTSSWTMVQLVLPAQPSYYAEVREGARGTLQLEQWCRFLHLHFQWRLFICSIRAGHSGHRRPTAHHQLTAGLTEGDSGS